MKETVHSHPHPNYLAVFGYLVLLTLLSFLTLALRDKLPSYGLTLFVIAVAVAKASLVAIFFMHLKFEKGWKYVLVFPPLVMGILLVLALVPDIAAGIYRPRMRGHVSQPGAPATGQSGGHTAADGLLCDYRA